MMTLGLHPDRAGQGGQAVPHFFPAQVQVEEVGMEEVAEWPEVWDSWEAQEDQVVGSLDEDHRLALHPMLDLITS